MAIDIGKAKLKAAVPAATRMTRVSWVAYAVDERASDEKTAKPIRFPIACCSASAVGSGRPINQECNLDFFGVVAGW